MPVGTVPLARRNIFADRRRLATSVVGVGVAVALILLLQGLWSGTLLQVSSYTDRSGADLVVAASGAATGGTSVIPVGTLEQIRRLPGVDGAEPVVSRYAVIDLHDAKVFTSIVGYPPGGNGGPSEISRGRSVIANDEVVVDSVLAADHGLGLDDRIEILGTSFRVVGMSEGTRSWMTGYIFMSHPAGQALFSMAESTSMVLVQTANPGVAAPLIATETGLEALSTQEFGDNVRSLYTRVLARPFDLMVAIAFAAGTLIVALTVYSSVVERVREYGILRALGARSLKVFRIVLGQTLTLAGLGTVAGYVLFRTFAWALGVARPKFWIDLTPRAIAGVAVASLLMALLASIAPARRVIHLDPASVYRG